MPLDTLGASDPAHGRVVLISIGMSNATQEFSTFVPKAMTDPLRNPRLQVIDCAEGASRPIASTPRARPTGPTCWRDCAARGRRRSSRRRSGSREANADPRGGFPGIGRLADVEPGRDRADHQDKLPSVKLAYFTSRIYAGYATSTLNPEPYAYESGFAVKWLIEGQVAGEDSLNYDPGSGPIESPWMAWGPYLWADGLTPRSDGLTWHCS